jgi:hypothetical protein
MNEQPVRADAAWLDLREAADADARSRALVADLVPRLAGAGALQVHDLGGGSGAMGRWLAPLLPRAQRWITHDRDHELLALAHRRPPVVAGDGSRVTVETRPGDLSRLASADLAGASLLTASALLDMLTRPELDRVLDLVAAVGRPLLVTLSVTGEVVLDPPHPLDAAVAAAFDEHQRRPAAEGPRLGPDAAAAAVAGLAARGLDVTTAATPWRLGPDRADLSRAWFEGWVDAAYEQQPGLAALTRDWARDRRARLADGALGVTVHHLDVLALPPLEDR